MIKKLLVALAVIGVSVAASLPIHAQAPLPGDVVSQSAKSKTVYLGKDAQGRNRYQYDASLTARYYKDASNVWQDIDTRFVNDQMVKAPYQTQILQRTFNAGRIIQASVGSDSVQFQPMAMEWTNDLDQIQPIAMPAAVAGIVDTVGSNRGRIKWTGAYGAGRDFEWIAGPERLVKLLTINSLANLPVPTQTIINGGNPVLRLNLIFDASTGVDIYVDGALWDKRTKVQTFQAIEFKRNGQFLWAFEPLQFWDSEGKQGQSVATLRKVGSSLYIEIRVPYSWLQSAIFPIQIDATFSVGASSDDSRVYFDGTNWQITLTVTGQGCGYATNVYYKVGGGMRFTSINIPSGSTIDSAFLTLVASATVSATTVNSRITGEDVDDAATFSTLADYQARRGTVVGGANNNYITTAQVDWDSIAAWTAATSYNSSSIVSIIQEIIDRAGWVSGNDLVIFWDDHDNRSTNSDYRTRTGASWDNVTYDPPSLTVTWTEGGGGWTHEPLGIDQATIGGINSISKASIGKLKGIVP